MIRSKPAQIELRQLDRGELARAQKLGLLAHGGEGEIFFAGRAGTREDEFLNIRRRAEACGLAFGVKNHAGRDGVEDERGRGAVREVQRADDLYGLSLLGEAVDEHGALLGGERDGGDCLGGFDHGGRDL